MKIGYARTSTVDQEYSLETQQEELGREGCERIFSEKVSSVGPRPELDKALDYTREGDVLLVTKLDRLARNTVHLGEIIERLRKKKATVRIMNLGIDTGNATGELICNLLGSVAQFERKMMLERQKEGITKAAAAGKYKGRSPTARAKTSEIVALFDQGIGPTKIADQVGVARSSVYRILEDEGKMTATKETKK